MRPMLIALMLACAPALADESVPSSTGGAAPEKLVTLDRTACYGWCPVYSIAVYTDGTLEYNGVSWVKTKGKQKAKVTQAQLAALEKAFADAGYLALADTYTNRDVTDNPSCNTSFLAKGKRKSVAHYHGDRSAPEKLAKLEERVDAIVHIERFIGTEAEREELRKSGKLR
jgi:hypothetical protein